MLAGCQVVPPSVETSTPATTPPPASAAVPVMVTLLPSAMVAPAAGELIVELGGVVSLDAVVAVNPGSSVAGCAPMSASRLTVACCIFTSGGLLGTNALPGATGVNALPGVRGPSVPGFARTSPLTTLVSGDRKSV